MDGMKEVVGFFIFSYLEDNFCVLRPFDSFCVRGLYEIFTFFSIS